MEVVHFYVPFMEVYIFMYTLCFSLLHTSFLHKLWCLNFNIFLDYWEVWYLRYANVSVIHILKFHCLKNFTCTFLNSIIWRSLLPFSINALLGNFTLPHIISQLYNLYPNGYGHCSCACGFNVCYDYLLYMCGFVTYN